MKTLSSLAVVVASTVIGFAANASDGFVVHEWGTFTSVQGGDGVLVPWHANQIGDLPAFVHNWFKPGLERLPSQAILLGKGGLTSLQRMETPVIYFYADREFTADVTVHFPKGLITEWYPQSAEIGPTSLPTNSTMPKTTASKESLIRWPDVRVLPAQFNSEIVNRLPMDTNGTHYFATRETDSAYLRVNNPSKTNPTDEHEKFLFYRGSGNFSTPLVVTVTDDEAVRVENTGNAPLAHLFLLHVENGAAEWAQMKQLAPYRREAWRRLNSVPADKRLTNEQLKEAIGGAMAGALTDAGLFPAEAKAMVKTWSNAWFSEEGVRALYILPREWTDETLPLKLDPKPDKVVRVMVGRAEIITPAAQRELASQLALAKSGDARAKQWVQNYSKKFGRFAPPAFQLANHYLTREQNKPVASADEDWQLR